MSKLSVKHFELLANGTHVSWNSNGQTKNAQNVFVTFMESERRKNNCYLAFGDKNDDFSLFGTFSKI